MHRAHASPCPTHTQSETVVEAALGVFAAIAVCPGQFRPMVGALLNRFRGDTGALLLQVGAGKGGGGGVRGRVNAWLP